MSTMSKCRRFARSIVDRYIDDPALQEHVKECSDCGKAYSSHLRIVGALRRMNESKEPDTELEARIQKSLKEEQAERERGSGERSTQLYQAFRPRSARTSR